MRWALVVLAGLVASVVAVGLNAPRGHGGAWDDDGPDGHSALAERLSDDRSVLAIESSLSLLPRDAGPGDTLFLFPTHRPASHAEVQRVQEFVAAGGQLVLAADGSNAAPWAEALGVRFKGLPALLPPDATIDCVPTQVPLGGVAYDICLPSPTTFPDLDHLTSGDVSFSHVAYSGTPVFLDADLDGELGAGDQGPLESPLVLQWRFGASGGRVVAVADADVWRNALVRDHPGNLEFARALAAGNPGAVYVDSSGTQPTLLDRVANPGYRLLSGPDMVGQAILFLLLLGTATGAWKMPRIAVLQPHDPPQDTSDPDVAHAAQEVLREYLHDSHARRSAPPARPAAGNT